MCHVYLGSHYSHFWWGWNEMGNPFMAGLTMVLEDLWQDEDQWAWVRSSYLCFYCTEGLAFLQDCFFFFFQQSFGISWNLIYFIMFPQNPYWYSFHKPLTKSWHYSKGLFPFRRDKFRLFPRSNASGTLQWAFFFPQKRNCQHCGMDIVIMGSLKWWLFTRMNSETFHHG